MNKIPIAILGPSDIAFRRFVPAILNSNRIEYIGVACANANEWSEKTIENDENFYNQYKKAESFRKLYNGDLFESFEDVLSSNKVEAVYIPLPPGLHYKWAMKAIEKDKHVLLEKPFTTNYSDTIRLIEYSKKRNVALHENYAFIFHKQIKEIKNIINSGTIGQIRLISAHFGFPYRGINDFRYSKNLGGGALNDCGGYPIKIASYFLGKTTKVATSQLANARDHDVDVYGSASLVNDNGLVAQISFGMDNYYKCELEIWGSRGRVYAPRIFTPLSNMKPKIIINGTTETIIEVEEDDQFRNSAEYFCNCISDSKTRNNSYSDIKNQSKLVNKIKKY